MLIRKEKGFELSDKAHEYLKKVLFERGIIFEEETEKSLNQIFNASSWNVLSNVCFREKGLDEEFDGRFEIDFIVKRSHLVSELDLSISDRGLDLDFLNPYFLIEAKSSTFDWCFFDLNGGAKKKSEISFFVEKEDDEEKKAFFAQKEFEVSILKRALSVRNHVEKVTVEKKDLIRDSVRQLIKNMQIFMRKDLEKKAMRKMLIPLIVTNAPLIIFSSLFDDKRELNLRTHKKHPYLCFEFDDFLFWKGGNVETRIHDSRKGLSYENFSKIHVWIVNENHLEEFIHKILPEKIQQSLKIKE